MREDDDKPDSLVRSPGNGLSVTKSTSLAARGRRDLLGAERARGYFELGLKYQIGNDVPRDENQAAFWYRKAAELGHAEAQICLAALYEAEDGPSKDDVQAAFWYREAAALGNSEAQVQLAVMFGEGRGVPRDPERALFWLRESARRENVVGQLILAFHYEEGDFCPRDYAQAIYWYTKSALSGRAYGEAEYHLGRMYQHGLGVRADREQALRWYQKAADFEDDRAKTALALMAQEEASQRPKSLRAGAPPDSPHFPADSAKDGMELPDIDADEFSFVFDYSDDGATYFVLYGERVILSGRATDDPEDYITDSALGGQFIEIARKLKKRYGAKLVDLIPTPKASSMLMDIYGWALKRERGRKIVQQGLGAS